jgi:hypothetical protein
MTIDADLITRKLMHEYDELDPRLSAQTASGFGVGAHSADR